jgi:hypothetical protein
LPLQSVLAAHISHWPAKAPLVAQIGCSVVAAQSVLAPHATHVSALEPDLLQIGVSVLALLSHCAFVVHATHTPAFGSPDGAQYGAAPPQSELPSQEHGTPSVLNSHSVICWRLVAAPPPAVDPLKPANACDPTRLATFTVPIVATGDAGFVALCAR